MPSLKVMTWNVENLFLPEDDATGEKQQQFQSKLANLAAVIDQQQPDVLALQEIGPEGAFPALIRPIQQRDPIFDDAETPEDESLTAEMGRGGLEVTLKVEGITVSLLHAYFKSKLISYARKQGLVRGNCFQPNDEGERYRYAAYALCRRTGEAVTLRERVNQLLVPASGSPEVEDGLGRQKPVIVCGDLNDETDAATTQILQGPAGSEIGTGGIPRGDKGDGYRLWNLAPLLNLEPNGDPPAEGPPRGCSKAAVS